ncbi:FAD-dependent monooxygenase [Polynucleobacter sp. 30F-ANTBAC]|jgi:2-polyprenylphenol 6-hydroxylase|uniref:FAD-dependent monooxygenase n=1 Tax=Polynucleobacter sp. 30F-ANTBAC TaxID=2689095 RepID=UPI001C0B2165|nr:FAD-dependent monooxygenase [Polynucleobacter sp. 30F-ANTBAC]MBU3599884.1 FAD-dependent monooxygenase [Polynucleobacter sp. 30F-ANTBAC]
MNSYDLIIVGAGIAGKATALRLARLGLKIVHIAPNFDPGIHCNDDLTWDSRIYALSSSSQQLLSDMNVWAAMDHGRTQIVSDMRIFGDSGQAQDELHFSAYSATVPQLAWIVEASHIERTLDAASQFQGNIQRITDKISDFISTKDAVTVHTESGQSFTAKLLIAADGARSPIREKLQIETPINDYGQTAVVANFECELDHQGTACQWFLENGEILALLPLPNKKLSMVWSAQAAHAEQLQQCNPETLSSAVMAAAFGSVRQRFGTLKVITNPKNFPLRRMKAQRIIAPDQHPRIILIGDAAHVMHPLAGQGLNLGLRDVATLGQLIETKEAFRSIDDPVLLRRYERSRHGDTDALLFTTDQLQKLFASPSGLLKTVRNMGMGLVNRSRFLKRQLIKKALS